MPAPLLIFAWGNPSRGDDALGPLFAEQFAAHADGHHEWGEIEYLTDFQLQVEHALDLKERQRVLFVDASASLDEPCRLEAVGPRRDTSFSTHAMSPQAVLHVYTEIEGSDPPPSWLLSIRGDSFELGEPLSANARGNLEHALALAACWLENPP